MFVFIISKQPCVICYYTHFTDVDIEARREVLGNSPKVLLLGSGRGSFCMLLPVIPLLALNLPINSSMSPFLSVF